MRALGIQASGGSNKLPKTLNETNMENRITTEYLVLDGKLLSGNGSKIYIQREPIAVGEVVHKTGYERISGSKSFQDVLRVNGIARGDAIVTGYPVQINLADSTLYSPIADTFISWGHGVLGHSTGGFDYRLIDLVAGQIRSNSNEISIGYCDRTLYSSGYDVVMNWANRSLTGNWKISFPGTDPNSLVDYSRLSGVSGWVDNIFVSKTKNEEISGNKIFKSSVRASEIQGITNDGGIVLDTFRLIDIDTEPSINWNSRHLYTSILQESVPSLNWENRSLSGNWSNESWNNNSGSLINYFRLSGVSGWANSNFATDNLVVHRTGNELISGDKTFANPILTNAIAPVAAGVSSIDMVGGILFNGTVGPTVNWIDCLLHTKDVSNVVTLDFANRRLSGAWEVSSWVNNSGSLVNYHRLSGFSGWAAPASANYLYATGNQLVSGTKTFTTPIAISGLLAANPAISISSASNTNTIYPIGMRLGDTGQLSVPIRMVQDGIGQIGLVFGNHLGLGQTTILAAGECADIAHQLSFWGEETAALVSDFDALIVTNLQGGATGARTGIRVNNAGNVSIDTLASNAKLTIRAGGNNLPLTGALLWNDSTNASAGVSLDFANHTSPTVTTARILAQRTSASNSNSSLQFYNFTNGSLREHMRISESGNVGIGVVNPSYHLEVSGSFAAASKSFVIPHPTIPGKRLQHGVIEGPEHSVFIRGRLLGSGYIQLPDYWRNLVHEDSITVQLTPIGKAQKLYVKNITVSGVEVGNSSWFAKTNCHYFIAAERKDIPKLEVEL